MVENKLDYAFQALSSPIRRAMLDDLARSERTVTELAQPHDVSLAAASKHIKVLERAGMVERSVSGRVHTCRLVAEPLADAFEWLSHYRRFWQHHLDALEAAMRREDETT